MTQNKLSEPLTEGKLVKKIIFYTLPLMLTGMLQLTFSCADNIVVGQLLGSEALATLAPTGPLVTLIVNVLLGLSTGAEVCTAQSVGAGRRDDVHQVVHTALLTAILGGILFGAAGFIISRPCLQLMDTPAELIDGTVLYMQIYFAGLPFVMFFNFGAGILRSFGDTKHPLYYLSAGGALNFVLNLIFVALFGMGIFGVAAATLISQIFSALLVAVHFLRSREAYRLEIKKLKIWPKKFTKILYLGIPAGLQGTVFSFSNVLIQSSINSFGPVTMSGNSAAVGVEGFVYTAMNSFYHTSLTFMGQHIGAGKIKRAGRALAMCLVFVTITGAVLGTLMCFFGDHVLFLYLPDDPEAVAFGMMRVRIICSIYFICGVLEVLLGAVQGMGASVSPMLISLFGACVIRIFWIAVVFKAYRSLTVIYLSYPVSWIITAAAMLVLLIHMYKKVKRGKFPNSSMTAETPAEV